MSRIPMKEHAGPTHSGRCHGSLTRNAHARNNSNLVQCGDTYSQTRFWPAGARAPAFPPRRRWQPRWWPAGSLPPVSTDSQCLTCLLSQHIEPSIDEEIEFLVAASSQDDILNDDGLIPSSIDNTKLNPTSSSSTQTTLLIESLGTQTHLSTSNLRSNFTQTSRTLQHSASTQTCSTKTTSSSTQTFTDDEINVVTQPPYNQTPSAPSTAEPVVPPGTTVTLVHCGYEGMRGIVQDRVPDDSGFPEAGLYGVLLEDRRPGDEVFVDLFQMDKYCDHPSQQAALALHHKRQIAHHRELHPHGKGKRSGKGAPQGGRAQRARDRRP
jgi:hypothetical protein